MQQTLNPLRATACGFDSHPRYWNFPSLSVQSKRRLSPPFACFFSLTMEFSVKLRLSQYGGQLIEGLLPTHAGMIRAFSVAHVAYGHRGAAIFIG